MLCVMESHRGRCAGQVMFSQPLMLLNRRLDRRFGRRGAKLGSANRDCMREFGGGGRAVPSGA